jgi:hypothetical protein
MEAMILNREFGKIIVNNVYTLTFIMSQKLLLKQFYDIISLKPFTNIRIRKYFSHSI